MHYKYILHSKSHSLSVNNFYCKKEPINLSTVTFSNKLLFKLKKVFIQKVQTIGSQISVHQFVFIIELVTVARLMANVVISLFILLLDSQRVLNCGNGNKGYMKIFGIHFSDWENSYQWIDLCSYVRWVRDIGNVVMR